MGRIKTRLIKRLSIGLLNRYFNEFKENFNENKKKLSELIDIPSKKLRNAIAGYVTRLKKKERA